MKLLLRAAAVAALLIGGFVIRLDGIGDPPLGFHPARQYHGLTVAKAMFVHGRSSVPASTRRVAELNRKRELQLEPPLLETVVATGYRLAGRELPVLGRVLSCLAWVLGALALHGLVRRLWDPTAALGAMAFYLLVPYAIEGGRSFQPDPTMVAVMLAGLLLLVRHHEQPSSRRLLAAAVVCGVAVLIKGVTVFMIAPVFLVLAALRYGRKLLRMPDAWVFAAVALVPSLAYYAHGVLTGGQLKGQFQGTFIPKVFLEGFFWSGWAHRINTAVGLPVLAIALVGSIALARTRLQRGFVGALWAGYLLYAAAVPFHIATHDYYQLPLVPIVALGFGVVGAAIVRWLQRANLHAAAPVLAAGMLAVAVAGDLRDAHPLAKEGIREEVAQDRAIGRVVGHSSEVLLLPLSYGIDLKYHGDLSGVIWPSGVDDHLTRLEGKRVPPPAERYDELVREIGAKWFVINDMTEWLRQPQLQRLLDERAVLVVKRPEYVVYRLERSQP